MFHIVRNTGIKELSKRANFSSIAVIGGGISGLSALKELTSDGHSVKLFESSNDIGGQWNVDNPTSNMWSEMYSNTTMHVMFYSDYPYIHNPNTNLSYFGQPHEILNHTKSYAEYFNLYEHIQFNSNIKHAEPADEHDPHSDGWNLYYSMNDNKNKNDLKQEQFDKIIVCTGAFNTVHIPQNISDILLNGGFKGKIYTSQQINSINFENKRVLIIGGGVTGSEIAELACNNNANNVYLNYRNKFFFLPFYVPDPDNYNDSNKVLNFCDVLTNRGRCSVDITELFNENQRLEEYGFYVPPKTFDKGFPRFVYYKSSVYHMENKKLHGIYGNLIDVNNNGETLLFENLNNKNDKYIQLANIDIIVFATGWNYGNETSILSKNIYNKMYNRKINPKRRLLYQNTFIPGYKQKNLAFIGLNVCLLQAGYELQSRLISSIWSNRCKLIDVNKQLEWINNYYIKNDMLPWHPAVATLPYMDEIAEIIGILPNKNDFPNKQFYERVQHERLFSTQYRIKGYGQSSLAISTLLYQMNTESTDNTIMQHNVTKLPQENVI